MLRLNDRVPHPRIKTNKIISVYWSLTAWSEHRLRMFEKKSGNKIFGTKTNQRLKKNTTSGDS
jgi:hypothetical protein